MRSRSPTGLTRVLRPAAHACPGSISMLGPTAWRTESSFDLRGVASRLRSFSGGDLILRCV
eukprot:scaffold902_cov76-Phaeocystis_antarctica.AAC.1